MVSLHTIASLFPVRTEYGSINNVDISTIAMDSRDVREGSLFFCIPGYTVDGHDYAESAVQNGAAALVSDRPLEVGIPYIQVPDVRRAMALAAARFYEFPSMDMQLIGVTGTNGKTSVTHFIEQMLQELGSKTGMIGTMYTRYDGKQEESVNTTPESLTLQKLFNDMRETGVKKAVMEVSSHALVSGRTHGTQFDVAVYTNLSQDHLDFHYSMEDYARAKSLLFAQLGSSYERNKQTAAVINADDEYSFIMEEASAAPVILYGLSEKASIRAENLNLQPGGSSFDFCAPGVKQKIHTALPGKFSVYNVLAAASALYGAGYKWESILPLLSGLRGVTGRFEPVLSDVPVHVIVDYAHTPDSLNNVLETISGITEKSIYTVVGCGGNRDKAKRPLMASEAERHSTHVYLTSDNPRLEEPGDIIKDMEKGMSGTSYTVIEDRKKAIFEAVKHADEGDVVLIAGKGHETYQEIGRDRFDFNDRLVAEEALKEWE